MILDFGEESVTQCNCILKLAMWRVVGIPLPAIPEAKLIEKMKARPVKKNIPIPPFVCAEKDRAANDTLQSGSDSLVIVAGGGRIEVTQEFGKTLKVDYSALLTERQRCDPDGDQAVLAVR